MHVLVVGSQSLIMRAMLQRYYTDWDVSEVQVSTEKIEPFVQDFTTKEGDMLVIAEHTELTHLLAAGDPLPKPVIAFINHYEPQGYAHCGRKEYTHFRCLLMI